MTIYGLALLAFCYIVGQLLGEGLGNILGINANVGGVGFAMLLLIILNSWLGKKDKMDSQTQSGIQFWNQMYIPIIVAMSATQNVKLAVSSGAVALLAGIIPVVISFITIPYLSKLFKKSNDN
jgi:malonate transporter MadL subunit